jgi:hypothetical protein
LPMAPSPTMTSLMGMGSLSMRLLLKIYEDNNLTPNHSY